jgi:hypothetical protein
MVYMKKTVKGWIGCDVFNTCYHVSYTSVRPDIFIEIAGVLASIWLCEVCMPNSMKYVPVSNACANERCGYFGCFVVDERITAIYDGFDATTISAVNAYDRHCSNLRLLESRLSSAATGSEGISSLLLVGH